MYPRGSKDGHDPSHPPRAPSTTKTEPEETHKEDNDESSHSEVEEEIEDGHENHSTSGPGSPSTRHQSGSGATASPSNTATAPGTFLRYRRYGDSSSSDSISVPPPQAQAQPSTRPHDPQTPSRNTSRGPEGDFQAGHIPRYHTQPGYHRNLTNARENHAENPSEENSAAVARARGAESPFHHRPPLPQTLPPDHRTQLSHYGNLTARVYHAKNLSEPYLGAAARARGAESSFYRRLPLPQTLPPNYRTQPSHYTNLTNARENHAENSSEANSAVRPHVPGMTWALFFPFSDGYGSSLPAIDRFRREAAQLALEQQNGRQQRIPSPDLPRPVRRPHAPHPAHNHPSDQSSTSQQPGQPSTQPPQDPTRPTRGPSRRQPEDDED